MKKETIFAIILGVAAGVGVAFFMVLKARESQIQKAKPISTINLTPSVAIQNTQITNLEVSEPETGFITSSKAVTIKGKATKNSLLVVQSPIKNIVQELKADNFTINSFPLAQGENVIHLTVYPKNPQFASQEKEIRVYLIEE